MDIDQRIEEQLKDFPVLLYMKGSPDFPQCGFSAKVCGILKVLGQRFAFVNILEDPDLRDGLKIFSNWPTFPQLYINNQLVGGSDIVETMYENGELEQLLKTVEDNS
jgi:monothiol glutaredoxin